MDDLLWGWRAIVRLQGRMLAAIKLLYASGTLSMGVDTAGDPGVQCTGLRQGCRLTFNYGCPERFLRYADDVILLSDIL